MDRLVLWLLNLLLVGVSIAIAILLVIYFEPVRVVLAVVVLLALVVGGAVIGRGMARQYRVWKMRQTREAIEASDRRHERLARAGRAPGLDKFMLRKAAARAWDANNRIGIMSSIDNAALVVPLIILAVGVVAFFGWLYLGLAVAGAIGIDILRSMLRPFGGPAIALVLIFLVSTAVLGLRQELAFPSYANYLKGELLGLEQYVAVAIVGGLLFNAILLVGPVLSTRITSGKVISIEERFARELCIEFLLEAVEAMSQEKSPYHQIRRDEAVEALSRAAASAIDLGDLLAGELGGSTGRLVVSHFHRFSSFLHALRLGVATSSRGWAEAQHILCSNVVALLHMNYEDLDVADHEEQGTGLSKLRRALGIAASVLVSVAPLALVLFLPSLGVPLPTSLQAPLLFGLAVYAAVGVLLVLDPRFRERADAAHSVVSLVTSAAAHTSWPAGSNSSSRS